jgi:phage antirepressor YoqD-like protein
MSEETMVSVKDIPEETIDISIVPVEMPTEIGTEIFEKQIIKFLLGCLKRNWTKVSANCVAKQFKVDQKELEKWANTNKEIIVTKGTNKAGVLYLSLAKKDDTFPVGSDDFERSVALLLTEDKKVWKSSRYLSKKLNVDEKEFLAWAYTNKFLVRKLGKEDDVIYWGLLERFNLPEKKESEKNIPSSTSDEERFALAIAQTLCNNLVSMLNTYGNRLATRHKKPFKYLVRAQKELLAGVALLRSGLKINENQLPKIEEV